MIKIFGKKFAEMRDIEDAKKEVYENMKKHFEKVDDCFEAIGDRLVDTDKDIEDIRNDARGVENYLKRFADEVFTHLPAKKSNVPLEYHHKRVAKALTLSDAEREKRESEQAKQEA